MASVAMWQWTSLPLSLQLKWLQWPWTYICGCGCQRSISTQILSFFINIYMLYLLCGHGPLYLALQPFLITYLVFGNLLMHKPPNKLSGTNQVRQLITMYLNTVRSTVQEFLHDFLFLFLLQLKNMFTVLVCHDVNLFTVELHHELFFCNFFFFIIFSII